MVKEQEMNQLQETIRSELSSYNYGELIHKKRQEKLKKEIVDLRDKIGDFGLRNDYLNCKVFELEDALERKKTAMKTMLDKEKRHGFKKMMLEN